MTEALRAVGISLLGAFLSVILKEAGFRGSHLFSALVMVASTAFAVSGIGRLVEFFSSISLTSEIESGIGYVMKIVGASYVFGMSSGICREIGESGISSAILAMGRIEIILLSIPAISEIFALAGELL